MAVHALNAVRADVAIEDLMREIFNDRGSTQYHPSPARHAGAFDLKSRSQ